MTQYALEWPPQLRYERADFLVSSANAAALAWLERWPDWPDRIVALIGPAGAGKTHLGSIWAKRSGAGMLAGAALAAPDLNLDAAMTRPLFIDDGQNAIGAVRDGEVALFHVMNLARERGLSLLIAAESPPETWGIRTPDLVSRLRLATRLTLGAWDDDLARAVIAKRFSDRQLTVERAVIEAVALHAERSFAGIAKAVAAIDRLSMESGKRPSRALALAAMGVGKARRD